VNGENLRALLRLYAEGGQFADDFHSFEADGDDLPDEAHDIFGVVRAIGIVGDAAAFINHYLILIHDPFERAAIVETAGVNFA
jgi:hypothetical protein